MSRLLGSDPSRLLLARRLWLPLPCHDFWGSAGLSDREGTGIVPACPPRGIRVHCSELKKPTLSFQSSQILFEGLQNRTVWFLQPIVPTVASHVAKNELCQNSWHAMSVSESPTHWSV